MIEAVFQRDIKDSGNVVFYLVRSPRKNLIAKCANKILNPSAVMELFVSCEDYEITDSRYLVQTNPDEPDFHEDVLITDFVSIEG